MSSKNNKIKLIFKNENFDNFSKKLVNLTKISDSIRIKIDNENIMLYSVLGSSAILAFKNYVFNTRDYLLLNDDLDFSLDIIIINTKKFVKNLSFLKSEDNIEMNVTYKNSQDDDNNKIARAIQLISGKLKINWITGEHYEVRDIKKSLLDKTLDIKTQKWEFKINKDDFQDIKKLSTINSDKIIHIEILNNQVIMHETSAWEMQVDEIDDNGDNSSIILNKRFLSSINNEDDDVIFHVFQNFMLFKTDDSNLMLSFEQSFED